MSLPVMDITEYTEVERDKASVFLEILENESITTLYQPIFSLKSGEVLGYEALSRGPENTMLYSPLKLIETAHELGKIWELEMLFRQKAIERAKLLKKNQLLFINVDPDIMKSNEFKSGLTKEYLAQNGLSENSIVFEITERTSISDYESFQQVLENYRIQGYQIAIDDVGAGYSGLKTINEVRPHFIKIDMDLIRNIDKDAFKQSLIKAFVDTSITTNIKVIAEGIETKEELKTLILLGVHAAQGFYLKQPDRALTFADEDLMKRIKDYNQIANNMNAFSSEYHYISTLVGESDQITYESMTHCVTIKSFLENTSRQSVCICDNGIPKGIVMKHDLDAAMSGKYGYAVFSNRPISKIMYEHALVVDYFTPINVVAKKAMERSDDRLFDDVIVVKGNQYFGLVNMKKIMEYALMYEKNNGKEHNPLSGLPGNPIINRVLVDLVSYKSSSLILYVDINEFKIYNDVYGFEKGDVMIRYLADMLKDLVKERFPYSNFLGHVGGDDFILVVNGEMDAYVNLCKMIISKFECDKALFFKEEHLVIGKIHSEDRFGVFRELPLTSLSVSGIYGDLSVYSTSEKLSEQLAKIKKNVKKKGESNYMILPC
ncbi:GGDEF domain-containing protein [Fusibacter sp. 3D3]|uniref:GGDEF domain-containing protein n=1 Tax=Fusibacter sp. 3D3 TaxID=1048380 RepID=UPI000857844E|nr:GGDEF domain-containing protein [Fusibacter sp. 3D3]GAU76922.1 EAL domain/GGDEF domain protein [Fusibacter sp. 3D3]